MLKPQEIIAELADLVSHDSIAVFSLDFGDEKKYEYEPLQDYISQLKNRVKPETATHELFKCLIRDVLHETKTFNEVNIDVGFIDYTVKQNNANPLLVELKPLFRLEDPLLVTVDINWKHHENQIVKYLKNNDYVILTDLRMAYLFNRNSILEFKPFETQAFPELLRQFSEAENMWDVIRRIEDQAPKIDLDKHFFEDLKHWYSAFQQVDIDPTDTLSKDELIVVLLNKIIFIKTLEDYGLVDFKFLTTKYESFKNDWEVKGANRVFDKYFDYIEDFFDEFYDTELFKARFWPSVDKTESNVRKFTIIFEAALGLDQWNATFKKGMIHYNFRQIDEDVFGKAYETFIAEGKKDSGIYYTPKEITTYMAKKLVDSLFEPIVSKILIAVHKDKGDFETASILLEQLRTIRIVDPTSGSGSFLIKVLREVYLWYKKIDDETNWIDGISSRDAFDMPAVFMQTRKFRDKEHFTAPLKLISSIVLHHIHAMDIDERALETAKTNIWKEAVKLSPRHYNYRRLNGINTHIQPNLELNYVCGDSLADLSIEKQLSIISEECAADIVRLQTIRSTYLHNTFAPSVIDQALQIKKEVRQRLLLELPQINNPIFICLEFFYCYFDNEGKPLPEGARGFHGVISNPPWEAIKPVKKEFAQKKKGAMDILQFDAWFTHEIESDQEFKTSWETYQNWYRTYNDYLSSQYNHQGSADPNFYKFYIERNMQLLLTKGSLAVLVPSGIQTDAGSIDLRKLLIHENTLLELSSFENRGYSVVVNGKERTMVPFPDVNRRFKFSIVLAKKEKNTRKNKEFAAKFYLLNPNELYEKEPIPYTIGMIEQFSPENLSIMEFEKPEDFELCKSIRKEHPLFGSLTFTLHSELHMTNDSDIFKAIKRTTREIRVNNFALYEGKMIHQYNSHFSSAQYFVEKEDAFGRLESKERSRIKRVLELENGAIDKLTFKLDLENYRLVYRAIGGSTNERTIISSIVPPNVVIGHSMNYVGNYTYTKMKTKINQVLVPRSELIFIMSLWNSLTLNYYIRNKISANLTMNFMNELPIPEASEREKERIIELGATLLSLKNDESEFEPLRKQLKVKFDTKADPIRIRAELEVLIAKNLYELTKTEWEYLTSTFTSGGESASKIELDAIIALSKELY